MIDGLQHLFKEQNVLVYKNKGISVCRIANEDKAFELTSNILSQIVDKKSVLYLSGGKTPKEFYMKLVKKEGLKPGAVGMIDERYGRRFHANSNEKMIQDTGFLRYLEILDIPFYPILDQGLSREETASEYDAKVRSLHSTFPKHVGVLGIGIDGHTAGLPAGSQKSKVKSQNEMDLVEAIDNFPGQFKERITMTFLGLAMLDILLVLVFGKEKRRALEMVFSEGGEEEAPGRFYRRPDIAQKTLLITDQEV